MAEMKLGRAVAGNVMLQRLLAVIIVGSHIGRIDSEILSGFRLV